MTPSPHSTFAAGGGEAGALIRAFDWASTPLGPIASWSGVLRTTVDQMLASRFPACLFWGPDLVAIYNDGYRPILGTKPEAMGQPLRVTWSEAWPLLQPIAQRALDGESTFIENFLVPVDRHGHLEDAWFTFNYGPVFDERGTVVGMLDTVVETTSQVQGERRLLIAAENLRGMNAALEQRVVERTLAVGRTWHLSPDMLCVIGGDGRFEAVNPAWEKALGWTQVEMMGAEYIGFVHPDDAQVTTSLWRGVIEHGLPVLRFENRYRHRDGSWRWLSWVAAPEDGKAYCIARDVTEEKSQAASLAARTEERDVLARIVETTDAFIQVLDNDYRFLAINEANAREYEHTIGRRPLIGDDLRDLLDDLPRERETALALWGRAMAGESFTIQREFGDVALSRRMYEMKFEVLRAPDGHQVGAFSTSTDVTDRLREQRELVEAQETLRQSQKMEAVGQLTGGIAHDFNNPLAAIGSSLEVMRLRLRTAKVDDVDRYVDMSERSVRRAAALTQRLLAFSRRQVLAPQPTDVNALVQGMVELVDRTMGSTIVFTVESPTDLWHASIDTSQMENALLNLCINARDAMPSGGRLILRARNVSLDASGAVKLELPPGDYVCLSVSDTGSGMSAETMRRVFEPFFTTKPPGQGTGLGLSMVQGFAHQSGGRILAESVVGEGSTLTLYLRRFVGDAREPLVHDGTDSLEAERQARPPLDD